MKITVLGSGMVGQVLASKFIELGHDVWMATRDPEDTKARTEPNPMSGISFSAWYAKNPDVALCSFGQMPEDSDLIINATAGVISLKVLEAVGEKRLEGKVLLDLANPLDFSKGMPPTLTVCNTDSLGEQIQRRYPSTKVVKGLNTLNCLVMVAPDMVPGDHQVFICGNESDAKDLVGHLLHEMGWPAGRILDLGGIASSRGTEMLMPFWMSLMGSLGTAVINYKIEKP